ncbi:uncharacterized protein LOC132565599 [Ylistrum balloti]|uniref:uncharacterized protein LOC132565599 n=1 Tax=Ylistrum balloti TaxID=509963 RepID=UPI0029058129|nr:uncharacterized protein LOC132565599 [Ylistrum balloti]
MKCLMRELFPCLMLLALCSSLPVRTSLRDKSALSLLKQKRSGEESSMRESVYLIAMVIGQMDENHDGMIDINELQNLFLTMNQNIDVDTAQYLSEEVFGSLEFEHNDGKLPIIDLAIFFDSNYMGIF